MSLIVDIQKSTGQKTDWFEILPAQLLSTATRTSGMFDNPYRRGMILTLVTANEVGSTSFTPSIQTVDFFGSSHTVFTADLPITVNGTYHYLFVPVPVVNYNGTFREIFTLDLPREWKLVLTYAGTPANDKMDTKASAGYI